MHILIGILLILAGTLVTLKGDWLYENFGTIGFFDEWFRTSGGGRFGYKISGVVGILVGVLVLTNIHASILQAIANLFIFKR